MCAFSRLVAAGSLTLAAALWAWSTSPAWAAATVQWEPTFEAAMQKAAQQNQPVLIHFFNDGCPPCEIVERQVFPNPQVAQTVNANCVAVKVHAGQRADLAQRFGITRWPQDVMITPSGQKLGQYISPQDPAQYSQMVYQVTARERQRASGLANGVAQASNNAAPADDRASSFPLGGAAGARNAPAAPAGGDFPLNGNRGMGPAPQNQVAGAFRGGVIGQPQPYTPPPQGPMQPQYGGQVPPGAGPNQMSTPYGGGLAMNPTGARPGFNPNATGQAPSAPQAGLAGQMPMGNAPAQVGQPSVPNFSIPSQQPPRVNPGMTSNPGGSADPPQSAARQAAPPQSALSQPQGQTAGPKFALDGYCVVSLVDQMRLPPEQQRWEWRRGDPRWGAMHRGQTYLFAGPAEQQRFLANPDYYTPILSGYDPVAFLEGGQLVDGRREHGFTHEGKIYMFANEQNLQRFWNGRDMYIARVHQAMNAAANQQRR